MVVVVDRPTFVGRTVGKVEKQFDVIYKMYA